MQYLQPNTTLQGGKYRIERVLGQGGFGITYRAIMRDRVSGKLGAMEIEVPVAIKEFFMKDTCLRNEDSSYVTVPSTGSKNLVEQYRKKFVKEANNLSHLNHPNIVQVIDVFQENGTDYYVMEYLEGGSLRDLIKREGKLDETKALGYVTLIGYALHYMHTEKSLCHYDVKPNNIMLDKKGTPKLIDFGISKNYDSEGNQTSSTPVGISKGFAPLEQYQQSVQEFSPQTDVYALGATLYYLLSGNVPPEASVVFNDGLPALPYSYNISKSTRDAIEKAMQPRKKDRPQTMKAFLELLLGNAVAIPKPVAHNPKVEDDDDEGTYYAEEGASVVTPPYSPSKSKVEDAEDNEGTYYAEEGSSILSGVSVSSSKESGNQQNRSPRPRVAPLNKPVSSDPQPSVVQNPQSPQHVEQNTTDKTEEKNTGCLIVMIIAFGLVLLAIIAGISGIFNTESIDYTTYNEKLVEAAEKGDYYAQFSLAECYADGKGVGQNYLKAEEWFIKGTEQGNAVDEFNMGLRFYNGNGVVQDYTKAVEWYTKSAEHGDAAAQNNLGVCYATGKGVIRDYTKAVEWYTKSAEQGNANAQNNLGFHYNTGVGVEQNYSKAFEWFTKSANQGNAFGQFRLGYCYENGWGIAKDLQTAISWYKKAAEQEDEYAMKRLKELNVSFN